MQSGAEAVAVAADEDAGKVEAEAWTAFARPFSPDDHHSVQILWRRCRLVGEKRDKKNERMNPSSEI